MSEVQLRLAMIKAGVWLTYGVCGAGMLYAAFTWSHPNRGLVLSLLAAGMVGGVVISLLPLERIVRSRFEEAFFLSWSLGDVALVAAIVAADGGASSAYAAVFFLPLLFAALFYPLRDFVVVGIADVFAYVAASAGTSLQESIHIPLEAAALAATAVMCAWLAQSHDRERGLLNVLSRTDPLTEALNRRGFEERIDAELADTVRSGQPLSLLMLDLDGFKAVNDKLGHAAGDELLCWLATEVTATVRPMDSVGRLGGDEFAVLLPGTSETQAREAASRVRERLSQRIGVTIGVAGYPQHGTDREQLYRSADAELYRRKQGLARGHPAEGQLDWAATLARAVDTRMGEERRDTDAVRFATGLASGLGWSGHELESIGLAAMVHDVGKVPVPDRILRKPGPLDPHEYEEVKQHLVRGAEMIGRIDGMGAIAPWLRHARENYDGSGYPDGLAGEQIPLAARMLRVVDAFSAMTSERPYRPAMSRDDALEQLRRNAGLHFDPRCVVAFERFLVGEAERVSG